MFGFTQRGLNHKTLTTFSKTQRKFHNFIVLPATLAHPFCFAFVVLRDTAKKRAEKPTESRKKCSLSHAEYFIPYTLAVVGINLLRFSLHQLYIMVPSLIISYYLI